VVGAAPLRLAAPAQARGYYRLPSLYVVNTGSQTTDYLVRVQRLAHPPGRDVPASRVSRGRTTSIVPARVSRRRSRLPLRFFTRSSLGCKHRAPQVASAPAPISASANVLTSRPQQISARLFQVVTRQPGKVHTGDVGHRALVSLCESLAMFEGSARWPSRLAATRRAGSRSVHNIRGREPDFDPRQTSE
jgi:hypothetical protein